MNVPRYSPSRSIAQSSGRSRDTPLSLVMCATTFASLRAMKMLSITVVRIAIGDRGLALSVGSDTTTRPGESVVIQRSICRQNREYVSSSAAVFGSICQTHESWIGNATDNPRPYRWYTSTGWS